MYINLIFFLYFFRQFHINMKMMMQQQQQQNLEAAASVTSPSSSSSRPSTTASVAALVMPEQGNLSKGIDNKTVRRYSLSFDKERK